MHTDTKRTDTHTHCRHRHTCTVRTYISLGSFFRVLVEVYFLAHIQIHTHTDRHMHTDTRTLHTHRHTHTTHTQTHALYRHTDTHTAGRHTRTMHAYRHTRTLHAYRHTRTLTWWLLRWAESLPRLFLRSAGRGRRGGRFSCDPSNTTSNPGAP